MELDFFRMEKACKPPTSKVQLHRRRSFRDIQGVISKINPEVLKTVIASASMPHNYAFSVPSTPRENHFRPSPPPLPPPALPLFTPPTLSPGSVSGAGTAPLTIFYNGRVSVFDVSPHMAENIVKLAGEVGPKQPKSTDSDLGSSFSTEKWTDPTLARRKSLQSFLAKRRRRHDELLPYGSPSA